MARRRQKIVVKKLRFYSGQSPDDEIIEWFEQFDDAGHGVEGHEVKAALARGIQENGAAAVPAGVVDVDLGSIRQVVESAVTQVMTRFDVVGTAQGPGDEDEEAEELLDCLGGALVIEEDDE